MKKLKYFIIALLAIIIMPNVHAASFSTYLSGNKQIGSGGTVTVTVGVNNANDLYGFSSKLSYDSSKLTLVGQTALNGFGLTIGSNLIVDNSVGKKGSFAVATLTFKATSAFTVGQSTTISLGTAEGSNGVDVFNGTGSSLTITVVPPKDGNANLSSLKIDNYDLAFDANKTEYSLTVDHNVDKINISATTASTKSTITGTGSQTLKDYNNEFSVVVTAENGTTKTYKITVIRKDENGYDHILSTSKSLKKLEIVNYPFLFDAHTYNYVIKINGDVTDLDIITETKDEMATVTVKKPEKFIIGENIITITVRAENGDERDYTISAIKLENTVPETNTNIILYIIIGIETLGLIGIGAYTVIKKRKAQK